MHHFRMDHAVILCLIEGRSRIELLYDFELFLVFELVKFGGYFLEGLQALDCIALRFVQSVERGRSGQLYGGALYSVVGDFVQRSRG